MPGVVPSCVVCAGPHDLLARVEKDGYFVLENFFDRDAVLEARREVEALLDESEKRHLEARRRNSADDLGQVDATTPFKSIYEDNLHTQFYFSARSKAYARLMNDMMNSDVIKSFIRGLAGSIRLRVDLCQRAQGYDDSTGLPLQGPLPWHRDTPGEFTFGIFFDDAAEGNWGGTTFIPGTHWNPLNPRWDLLVGEKENLTSEDLWRHRDLRRLPDRFLKLAPINGMLRKRLVDRVVEARGNIGGIYFFLNDTWHGRAANRTGRRNMASRFGGFATDFRFKDDIRLPVEMVDLPEPLRSLYLGPWEENKDPNTLFRRLIARRSQDGLDDWAAREKRVLLRAFKAMNAHKLLFAAARRA